jgi:hypothetical protein
LSKDRPGQRCQNYTIIPYRRIQAQRSSTISFLEMGTILSRIMTRSRRIN